MARKSKRHRPGSTTRGKPQSYRRSGEISWPRGAIPSVTEGKSPAADFAAALLGGNPIAEHLAGQAFNAKKSEPKEEASLADMFLAETYTIAKRLGLNAHQTKAVEPILNSYRIDLRKAHRFVLDNEFNRFATEVSSTTPSSKLLARLQYATIPYETTWIEFDLRTKVRTMHEVYHVDNSNFDWSQVADRLGLIIKRLSDTEATVELVCETFGDYGLIGTTLCYFFSTREYDFTVRDARGGCRPMIIPDNVRNALISGKVDEEVRRIISDDKLLQIGSGSLWGYKTDGGSTVIQSAKQMRDIAVPVFLARHGCLGTGRMREILAAVTRGQDNEVYGEKVAADLLLQETIEFTGMCRWIVTVLAFLNEVPISTQTIHPKGHIRTGLVGRRPLMDYHKVTLLVPKTKPIQFIERKFRTAARRRAHDVRAHWRTYLHDQHCNREEHAWEYDHDEGYRLCGKCMAFGRLIREHVRGDPKLGWVRKDYVIKKDPDA